MGSLQHGCGGPDPASIAVLSMHAMRMGILWPQASKQDGEGDAYVGAGGFVGFLLPEALHPAPKPKKEYGACKKGTLLCSSPVCLHGGIGSSASGEASQLLNSLTHDDKEGTEE